MSPELGILDGPLATSQAQPQAQPESLPNDMYADAFEHLRDELWRAWLCVAYHIHRRWELGVLPRSASDGNSGIWSAQNLASLLGVAEAEHGGALPGDGAVPAIGPDTAALALEAFRRQSARIERRLAATLAAGKTLPLVEIGRRFELTSFQRATLLMALMPELDSDLFIAYRYLSNDLSCRGLDARLLATMVYETPETRHLLSLDLSPASPLIAYRLLELDDGHGFPESAMYRRIQAAPRLVQIAALGAHEIDPQLREFASLSATGPSDEYGDAGLFPDELLGRVRDALATPGVILVLQGARGLGKRLVVHSAAASLGKRVLLLNGPRLDALPKDAQAAAIRGILREARLLDAVPVLPNLDDALLGSERRDELPGFVGRLCHEHPGAIAVTFTSRHLPRIDIRPVVQLALDNPSLPHRTELWRRSVPALAATEAAQLAERFAIPGGIIKMAAHAARGETGGATVESIDRAVRSQLHDRLSRLGRRLDSPYGMDDLVVEDHIRETLHDIVVCIRERRRVREAWGFRGAPGVSVLFSGSPGVGKTMSATVLARELGLAVYEIDLSSVVSKWIGETEKNLEEIFNAGEPGHAILLFNEADSLFGKRTSDVKSSNDRYANLETNYLLQRLEKFSGLAILTTNLVNAIDAAFRRRFAYDVQFSFPTIDMRTELWKRAVPPEAGAGEIDFEYLAERFELSGGFIKLALERSAFVAAGQGETLSTDVIMTTIQRMYLERGKLAAVGKLE